MSEEWLEIPKSNYLASSEGNIKSDGSGRTTGRILKQEESPNGYMKVTIRKNGKRATYSTHRLVAEAFLGIRHNQQVNHKDGNKANNKLSNLEISNNQLNQIHKNYVLGKITVGKYSHLHSKVIQKRNEGMGYTKIGNMFGLSKNAVFYICNESVTATRDEKMKLYKRKSKALKPFEKEGD